MLEGSDVVDLDEIDDEVDDDGQPQGTDPKLKTVIAQKVKWRGRAVDPKTGKLWSTIAAEQNKAAADETQKKVEGVNLRVDDIEIVSQHKLDRQDLNVLKGLASTAGKTPAEILADKESEAFKAFDAYKTGKAALQSKDNVIPEPSDRTPIVEGKSFGELDTPAKQKNYANTMDTLIKKGRGQNNRNLG